MHGWTGMYVTFLIVIGEFFLSGSNYYPPILTVTLLIFSLGFVLYTLTGIYVWLSILIGLIDLSFNGT